MKHTKHVIHIIASVALVAVLTFFTYKQLARFEGFWSSQELWSYGLIVLWVIVAAGYYHQGWLVHRDHSAAHVSVVLPIAVFFVQCILFVKGVYFNDWSLIGGAILVNSGVLFSLYNILHNRIRKKRS